MEIKLSDHFTYKRLLRFVLPSIVMMTVSSIYGIVDGFFVSNFVGKAEFTALNFIMPVIMILGGLGFIIGTGGSALVAKTMGQGEPERANKIFSMLIWFTLVGGALLSLLGILFVRPIAILIGAEEDMVDNCVLYARVLFAGNTFFMLQNTFSSFLVTAERPTMGLVISIVSGVTNMFLDFLFIYVFRWGLAGAAAATDAGQLVGALVPFIFFLRKNNGSPLRLGGFYFNFRELRKTLGNGLSEFVTNISVSVVGMVYNYQLLAYAGEDGVSANGVLMYVNFIFIGFFFGYSSGSAPVVSYHYGAGNKKELQGLLRKSLLIIGAAGVAMTGLAMLTARPLSLIFVSYDEVLLEMTVRAMMLYATSFLLFGFNVYASSFFTALNNGVVSAVLSVARTFFLQIVSVIVLPLLFGLDGIWLAQTASECAALLLSAAMLLAYSKRYGYLKD